tara:strand:+ start:1813 stop:1995 length:183 start_codon:yes stop_codon:yes gene_type:complete
MAKVKQMAWDNAEKQVDDILDKYKDNKITYDKCKTDILKVDNVELCGIYDYNVDEVIDLY